MCWDLSPSLQERYLSAAASISALAVGDPHVKPARATFRIRQDLSQNQHIEGLPLGTIGGILVHYNFPLDGEYEFQAKLYRTNLNIMRGLEFAHQVEFTADGQRVHLASIGGTADLASLFEKPTETGDAVDARLRVRREDRRWTARRDRGLSRRSAGRTSRAATAVRAQLHR